MLDLEIPSWQWQAGFVAAVKKIKLASGTLAVLWLPN